MVGAAQADDERVMKLWCTEYLRARVVDGKLTYIYWENPSRNLHADNENVKLISLDEIKEIFLKQIDYMLSPMLEADSFFEENRSIDITKIELRLTKLLMKDSECSYKLVPTWSFYGYEGGSGHAVNSTHGGEVCCVAVNAIDGSIVNFTAMN